MDLTWQGLVALGAAVVALTGVVVRAAASSAVERAVERKFRQWEVRFSKLHERRVEVMEETQDRLVALKRALDAASGLQPLEDPHGLQDLQEATDALNEAARYVAARRYYLPSGTAAKLAKLLSETRTAWASMVTGAQFPARGGLETSSSSTLMRIEGFQAVREKLPPLLTEVEEEFRRLVRGDSDD